MSLSYFTFVRDLVPTSGSSSLGPFLEVNVDFSLVSRQVEGVLSTLGGGVRPMLWTSVPAKMQVYLQAATSGSSSQGKATGDRTGARGERVQQEATGDRTGAAPESPRDLAVCMYGQATSDRTGAAPESPRDHNLKYIEQSLHFFYLFL